HKARFLALSTGTPFDPAAAEEAAARQPAGRLDWFLTGLERYREGKFAEAILACQQVLDVRNDDFWAHYVKALCQLQLRNWVGAKAELTVCLSLRPDFLWPCLLRGFAASEVGFQFKDRKDELLADAEFRAAEKDFELALKQDPEPLAQYVGLNH